MVGTWGSHARAPPNRGKHPRGTVGSSRGLVLTMYSVYTPEVQSTGGKVPPMYLTVNSEEMIDSQLHQVEISRVYFGFYKKGPWHCYPIIFTGPFITGGMLRERYNHPRLVGRVPVSVLLGGSGGRGCSVGMGWDNHGGVGE